MYSCKQFYKDWEIIKKYKKKAFKIMIEDHYSYYLRNSLENTTNFVIFTIDIENTLMW